MSPPRLTLFRLDDWVLPVVVVMLSAIGLAAIYSIDLSKGETFTFFPTQLVACGIGAVLFFFMSRVHIHALRSIVPIVYIVSLLLLIGVLFFGTTIRGTTGWFRIAGFSFQPVEFAKVAVVLMLPWLVERYGRRFFGWQIIVATALVTFVPATLILLQPDFGSALLLVGLWFLLLVFLRVRTRYLVTLVLIGVAAAAVAWLFLFAPYQKERIRTFLDPARDPLGSGYNVTQSIIAIGSGKLFGRGLGFGSQSQLHFLPEAQTDFLFSVIGEELGFAAAVVVIGLYFLLLWRLVSLARLATDDFRAYVLFSAALLFLVSLTVNIGATVGLLPVTGIPLPFLSYGGSALIMNYMLIGITASVAHSIARTEAYREAGGDNLS